MFHCEFCGRAFARKFNFARHLKTKHSNLNDGSDIDTNEYSNTSIADAHNISNITNKTDIKMKSDINDINGEINNNNKALPAETNNSIQQFPDQKDDFDCRMLAATEAIKQKFDSLRNSRNEIQNIQSMNLTRNSQDEAFMNIVPENNNAVRLEAKLPQLLQCLLDILLIKELQNVDIRDKEEEEKGVGEHRDVKLKRTLNSINEQENENEIKLFKRFKYNNSLEHKSDNDNSSTNSECVVKFWHNPSTLVGELRNLMTTTDIGQQIYTIMRRLNKINIKTTNYFEYKEQKENQNNLLRKLNELKKTSVGRQICCIFHELVKAEIIEPIDYVTNRDEYDSDEEENDNNFG